jgi:energy-coupling factor transporter transmembrane protein EcfT
MSIETLRAYILGPAFSIWTVAVTLILLAAGVFRIRRNNTLGAYIIYCIYCFTLFALCTGAWVWKYGFQLWLMISSLGLLAAVYLALIYFYLPRPRPARFDVYFVHGGQVLNQPLPSPARDIAYIKVVEHDRYYIPGEGSWLTATAEDSLRRVVTTRSAAS